MAAASPPQSAFSPIEGGPTGATYFSATLSHSSQRQNSCAAAASIPPPSQHATPSAPLAPPLTTVAFRVSYLFSHHGIHLSFLFFHTLHTHTHQLLCPRIHSLRCIIGRMSASKKERPAHHVGAWRPLHANRAALDYMQHCFLFSLNSSQAELGVRTRHLTLLDYKTH